MMRGSRWLQWDAVSASGQHLSAAQNQHAEVLHGAVRMLRSISESRPGAGKCRCSCSGKQAQARDKLSSADGGAGASDADSAGNGASSAQPERGGRGDAPGNDTAPAPAVPSGRLGVVQSADAALPGGLWSTLTPLAPVVEVLLDALSSHSQGSSSSGGAPLAHPGRRSLLQSGGSDCGAANLTAPSSTGTGPGDIVTASDPSTTCTTAPATTDTILLAALTGALTDIETAQANIKVGLTLLTF